MDSKLAIKALSLQKKGYNCAQATACAFSEYLPLDENIIYKMAEGFGSGMGDYERVCGALSGAIMVLSLLNSTGDSSNTSKVSTYELVTELLKEFNSKNKTTVCKELKGIETGIEMRSCLGCIEDAVKITENILNRRVVNE
jgi:C_GCAxxG_C_C family probable redox protein